MLARTSSAEEEPCRVSGRDYAERCAAFITQLASLPPRAPGFPKEAMPYYAARLQNGTEVAATLLAAERMTDATLHASRQDPFNLHTILHGYLVCPDLYPPELVAKFRAYAASLLADALVMKTRLDAQVTAGPPRVVFKNLASHTLALTWHPVDEPYGGQCRLDDEPVDYANYPMLDAPGIHQPIGGPLVVKMPDGRTITYDFKSWTIRR